MKEQNFKDLYEEEVGRDTLEWDWDPEEMVFRATDDQMRSYVLRPTRAILQEEQDETLDEESTDDEE